MQNEMAFHIPGNINEKGSIPFQLGNFFLKLQNEKTLQAHRKRTQFPKEHKSGCRFVFVFSLSHSAV